MISRKLPKKQKETILLQNFLSHKSVGLRVIKIEDSETPDFIIHELNKTIAVEITQLTLPHLKQTEEFNEELVDKAHKLFREKYKVHLYALITFSNTPIKCTANQLDGIVQQLFKMVEDIYLPNKKHNFRISAKEFQEEINWIEDITISNDLEFDHWQSFGGFLVNEIDINLVKKIISKKEKMIDEYKVTVDERWLLLAANFGLESDTHSFHYLKQETFESRFDKIYLFKYMEKEIYQLK